MEDYDDLTRESEFIKSTLRVNVEFEGFIGVSSHPHLEEEIKQINGHLRMVELHIS